MSPFKNKAFPYTFAILILANFFEVAWPTNNGNAGEIESIADSLKYLKIGELPRVISDRNVPPPGGGDEPGVFPPGPGAPPEGKEPVSGFGTGYRTPFEAKHIYTRYGVWMETPANSFKDLTSDPEFAKKWLVDHNSEIVNRNILPALGNPKESADRKLQKWLDSKPEIVLLDESERALRKDIDPLSRQGFRYTTINEHSVTQIRFRREGDFVIAEAYPYKSKLQFRLNAYNELTHFEQALTKPEIEIINKITTFDLEELTKQIPKITEDAWSSMHNRPSRKWQMVLNAQHPESVSARETFDSLWKDRPKTPVSPQPGPSGLCKGSSGGKDCAIVVDPETGKVQLIDSEKLVHYYNQASASEKSQLADIAGSASPKRIIAGGKYGIMVTSIVGLEDIKGQFSHLETIKEMTPVEETVRTSVEERVTKAWKIIESPRTKLSPARFASWIANSKRVQDFTTKYNGKLTRLGQYVLVKNIIVGINSGDTTSAAIFASRISVDLVGEGATKLGSLKFFSTATRTQKALKFISKVAGPLGAAHDAGANAFFLSTHVKTLKGAKDVYETNDAVIDIINDTVGMVAGLALLAAFAVPPLVPIMTAITLIAVLVTNFAAFLGHTFNEFAKINAEIPLLDYEKGDFFESRLLDWFGTRVPDYIDYLVQEKQANDLAVQENLLFLWTNPQLRGIVFPSKALHQDGKCRLTRSDCQGLPLIGCIGKWTPEITLFSGCDWNRPCPEKPCTDTNHNFWREFCRCDDDVPIPSTGVSRLNQFIDLTYKFNMYHDRALPKDVEGADFLCKPGSVVFVNDMISQKNPTLDYKCGNAIGIIQPKNLWENGQLMYFNLENGTDTVYPTEGDEETPNVFNIGEWGRKEFVCKKSTLRNEFIFNSTCQENLGLSGTLVGGSANNDSISFVNRCGPGNQLFVDFKTGNMALRNSKAFNFSISNIEEITGREGESDDVTVSCLTRRVALQGGRSGESPDVVTIGEEGNCEYNLTLVLGANTKITSNARNGGIIYVIGNRTDNIHVTMDKYGESQPKYQYLYLSPIKDVIDYKFEEDSSSAQLTFTLNGSASPATFRTIKKSAHLTNLKSTSSDVSKIVPPIFFKEFTPGSPQSVLLPDEEDSALVYHALNETFAREDENEDDGEPRHNRNANASRTGCPVLKNLMVVQGPDWAKLVGGNEDDEFVLHYPVQEIHGLGGEDTIRFHSNLTENGGFYLDLTGGDYTGIENVFASPGKGLDVTAGCDTRLIAAFGGTYQESLFGGNIAFVLIPKKLDCTTRHLKILAKGRSSLRVESEVKGSMDNVTVVAFAYNSSAPAEDEHPLDLSLSTSILTENTTGLAVIVFLEHKNWKIGNFKRDKFYDTLNAQLIGTGKVTEKINLRLYVRYFQLEQKYATDLPTIELVQIGDSNPALNEPTAQLLLESETGMPATYFILGGNATKVTGYAHIPNVFQVTTSNINGVVVDGVGGTRNTLIVEHDNSTSSESIFLVDLKKGTFGFLDAPEAEQGSMTDIQTVIGRLEKPDVIVANCQATNLNGLGGASDTLSDIIYNTDIEDCEPQQLTLNVGNFTRVINSAEKGNFTYIIHSMDATEIQMNPTLDNQQYLHFLVNPWDVVDKIAFDKSSESLTFTLTQPSSFLNDSAEVSYKMVRINDTQDYINPTFRFQRPDSDNVMTSIGVNKDGVITATYLYSGGAVSWRREVVGVSPNLNVFLINETFGTYHSEEPQEGSVIGSNVEGTKNQFYVFNLDSALGVLDGGECEKCTNLLHLDKGLLAGTPIKVYLGPNGYMNSTERRVIQKLRNIHAFYGRNSSDVDKVTVTSQTRMVAQAEDVIVQYTDNQDAFHLSIEVGLNTTVWFDETKDFNRSSYNASEDVFNYVFSEPRSFDPNGTEGFGTWLGGPSHNYIFPFTLDDLDFLDFDTDEEQLCYSLKNNPERFCHYMLNSLYFMDQFYEQPSMVTRDGFQIQVNRVGELYFSLGARESFPSQEEIESSIIPAFEVASTLLDATFIIQTDKDYLHIGHDNGTDSRNVLQSVSFSTSHLVGAGASHALYLISSLENKDCPVYIYPGFADDAIVPENDSDQQVLDLSVTVMDIRMSSGEKYVPTVKSNGKDLVISMDRFESKHPGTVTVVNGTNEEIWKELEVLLYQNLMSLVHNEGTDEWRLKPKPISIPSGFLYQLAPEDLEDNQEIVFDSDAENDGIPETSFILARNDSDLFISNIKNPIPNEDSIRPDVTTLVISSFFEEKTWKPKEEILNKTVLFDSVPAKISGVIITFPGLKLELDGTQIMQIEKDQTKSEIPEEELLDWTSVTREVEENLLKNATAPAPLLTKRMENYRETSNGYYGIWSVIKSFLRIFGRSGGQ